MDWSSATSSTFAVCSSSTFCGWYLRLHDHPHHPPLCCLDFLRHLFGRRPRTCCVERSDGVTVALESLSLSLSEYFGDVNSCLWLMNVARAHLTRWSNSTLDCVFEDDELAEVFDILYSGRRVSMFIPGTAIVLFSCFFGVALEMSLFSWGVVGGRVPLWLVSLCSRVSLFHASSAAHVRLPQCHAIPPCVHNLETTQRVVSLAQRATKSK